MEALMRVGCRARRKVSIVAGCLLLALPMGFTQKKPSESASQSTRTVLIDKARALESRGRPDMAVQLWQQVLLSEPNNSEALAGLAKDYKLMGAADKAEGALDRLRRANPNDPNIARIEALSSNESESAELQQAGELAKQGRADDAMRIYRQLYGDHPPEGDIGVAYYQTLYATATGKAAAVAGLRALADHNPGDAHMAVALGTMLTYDSRTRAEGIRILQAHPNDPEAPSALRQALIWNAANPASATELREYLKQHPEDTEVARNLRADESKLAQMNSGIARTPAERAAFAALNAHRLDEAQARFAALLEKEPDNGRVAAGMGFLRMQQKNFAGAVSYLTQAEQNGYKVRIVESALATSRFWYTMSEAAQALDENQFVTAQVKYRAALAMNPRSPEALNGLAGLLTKEQQYPAAAEVYGELIKVQPENQDGWRGLFLSYARENQDQKALAAAARFPPRVKAALVQDPEYLRTLATIYQAQGRATDAQRTLVLALALPFPDNGTTLKTDTRLQYAGILMEAKHYDQAAALYVEIVTRAPGNASAWMGLVSAHHGMGQDTLAIADVQKMPPATYESSLSDPGFLSLLGAIYQQANQFEVAQGFLERAANLEAAAGGQPSVSLQLQLAAIYLLRNNTAQAYALYRQVLAHNPGSADAWKGLISTLQATNRNSEALQQIGLIPAPVRGQLENDIEFEQAEAGVYAAVDDIPHALAYMNRVQAHYARTKTLPPPAVDVQNAWLLYNTSNDRALYPALMRLGSRNDLTVAERETVQDIWANWSVRRAAAAMDNGDPRRAVDILDAASQAFPDNLTVRKAVAGGYARVGRAKEALALYKTVPMQDASSGDFQGAIGAALAANDRTQAELWLRQALDRFTRDPAILSLAAQYEQARGDNQRAADYWRASLAAMPAASPVDRLAHQLVYPEQDTKAHRAVTAADLRRLLDPENEPFAKTTRVPPLPAYGPDPYDGSAPVLPAQPQPTLQMPPVSAGNVPANRDSAPIAPDSNPAVTVIPGTQPPNQQLFHQQSATRLLSDKPVSGQSLYGGWVVRDAVYRPPLLAPQSSRIPASSRQGAIIPLSPAYGNADDGSYSTGFAPSRQPALLLAQYAGTPSVPISANPPHSMASDAWKGLIFSLMAGNRNAEALQNLDKIPPDVRRQLEADIEFVQGVASLYVAVGDSNRATEYLNRVENYYLLHRAVAPAGLEVQHAWLLYNIKDDIGLYPVLLRLDNRPDLTPDQRAQVQTLWANWAVRRAETVMDEGNLLRGVLLLQAASQDYPDNMTVRRAVAGAYARVGRAADAVALFKTIPMDDAGSGDFVGAVSAAIGATDMTQAEAWLRLALARYPSDPGILALSARFEQARGNNERAADFWRAALAAMPPGSAVKSLDSGLAFPAGSYRTPAPGDTKRLLDPRNDPLPASTVPPLPAYPAHFSSQPPASFAAPPTEAAPGHQWLNVPSNDPLPLPGVPSSNLAPTPNVRGSAPSNALIYIPQSSGAGTSVAQPVLIEQSATAPATFRPAVFMSMAIQAAAIEPATSTSSVRKTTGSMARKATAASRRKAALLRRRRRARAAARRRSVARTSPYAGAVGLPPSEQTIGATGQESFSASVPDSQNQNSSVWQPARPSNPAPGLRITSKPMGDMAAQVQTLFAEQTDSQLTQGSASAIHSLPNAQVNAQLNAPPVSQQNPAADSAPASANAGNYSVAQYTPSATEAATGAYSVPRQPEQAAPPEKPAASAPATQTPTTARRRRRVRRSARQTPSTLGTTPTLNNAPEVPPAPPAEVQAPANAPYDAQAQPAPPPSTGAGLSDQELEQRDLPPLRGPWVRVQREARQVSPREEAEMQLQAIESGYSAWVGGTGLINYRSGALGYDHLAALEAPFEASMPLGSLARVTVVAKPVFLDSGQADGTATISVLEPTTTGAGTAFVLTPIPEPIGNLTDTSLNPPAQQNAVGLGGEVQLAFPHAAIAGGYTPYGFLVSTFTARGTFRPGNGPFTFSVVRDSEKDSQLSYAGLRDPAGDTLGHEGSIWGGVVYNQGNVQFAKGDAQSGFYASAGGQYLTGYNVESNTRIDGNAGAYWRVVTSPEYGNLSIGANFFAMHYANNENAFTYGMGGYFSPQGYFLANVPFTFAGHYLTKWHYNIVGGLGVQAFQENKTPLWPSVATESANNNPMLPGITSVGANYDLRGQMAYQISPHWFAGGFFGANNTRDYTAASAGFFVRFMFREQPSTAAGPTGLFPSDGLRPFTVP